MEASQTENRPDPVFSARVEADWIDHNGHMNVAYYTQVFDQAADAFIQNLGFTPDYRERKNKTMMAVESHVAYEREAHNGDHLDVVVRLAAYDAKRFHLFCEMFHREDAVRAATCEWMLLHVDFAKRRATEFDDEEQVWLERAMAMEGAFSPIVGAGRAIGLKAPTGSIIK